MPHIVNPPSTTPTSWLWHRPERAVTSAFMLGASLGAGSLGVFAMIVEQSAYAPTSGAKQLTLAGQLAAVRVLEAIVWGALVRAIFALAKDYAAPLLGFVCVVSVLITSAATVFFGIAHSPPSLSPGIGLVIAALVLTPALLFSFSPVLKLAGDARSGDLDVSPLEIAAAAWAWAAIVAAVGIVLAPGPYFGVSSGLAFTVAVFGLTRVYTLAQAGVEDRDLARTHARALIRRSIRVGATRFALLSAVLLPMRLYEQSITRNPAVIAIYAQGIAGHCDIARAGHEGDISLWLVDCGSNKGPTVGWDEREHLLLRDEQLFQRVPRLRSVPQISTAQPR